MWVICFDDPKRPGKLRPRNGVGRALYPDRVEAINVAARLNIGQGYHWPHWVVVNAEDERLRGALEP